MCLWDLAIYDCGHNGSFTRRDGGCALPTAKCNKARKNAVKHYMPWNCPDCAERLSRGIPPHPEDNIHPAERSVQQPMFSVALPSHSGVSRRSARIRKTPSPPNSGRRDPTVNEDGYDFSEFAEYANYATLPQKRLSASSPTKIAKRQRVSRTQYSSDTPAMVGRLNNIAEDLSNIAMPSARERRSGIALSPTNVHDAPLPAPTPSPAISDSAAGCRRRETPQAQLPPGRRISPTQPNAQYSANTYSGYAVASQVANRQKQGVTRAYQETLDDVKHMIQTGYPREEIIASAKFAMLSQKDQEEVFWPYHRERQARRDEVQAALEGRNLHHMKTWEEDKRDARRRKGGCVVM
ncbi:hypothetical protein AYL99_05286 [Fonsecaea erecta]|uniref:Uncharacterized protein n=1 Tax=Fonsecaea erecta TaxID=1367422 RepID=A0A178ZKG6_9EURO|nr:hypothetical protein AYL99_05286 [Fonsecaea erecta]OAP60284.1 hypothetical protein AYL99_05286 [Fonsecaea erecta]